MKATNRYLHMLRGELKIRLDMFEDKKLTKEDVAVQSELERISCRVDQLLLSSLEKPKIFSDRPTFGEIKSVTYDVICPVGFFDFKKMLLEHKPKAIFCTTYKDDTPLFVVVGIDVDKEELTYYSNNWEEETQTTRSFLTFYKYLANNGLETFYL